MNISVIVPTYKRTEYLKKCLKSLVPQTRLPEEIIVVTRSEDIESREVVKKMEEQDELDIEIKNVVVSHPGIVHAENKGLENVSGDIVCFIDDDAIAPSDWIEQIEKHFKDPNIGGVGGPCVPYLNGKPIFKKAKRIGKIVWFGWVIGNHHRLTDKPVYVDHLRGCNMAFRKTLVKKLDDNLSGYDTFWELDASLSVKEKGYMILYDPSVRVYHYLAPWIEEKRGWTYSMRYSWNYNNTYVFLKHFTLPQKTIFLIFTFMIEPLVIIGAMVKYRKVTMAKFIIPGFRGKWDGAISYFKHKEQ